MADPLGVKQMFGGWRCDACRCPTFSTIAHAAHKMPSHLKEMWQCTQCKQVHMASSLFPPCWKCGLQKFYCSYSSHAICCSHCSTYAKDPVTGFWYYALDAPLDPQPRNPKEQAASDAREYANKVALEAAAINL